MTHWKTEQNKSRKKRHVKQGVMTHAEEREYFGHGFESINYQAEVVKTKLDVGDKTYDVVLHADRLGRIYDIEGIPESDYDTVMYMIRGQQIDLYK